MNLPPFLYELIVAIATGIIQGLTEFVPVSSTAHMRLISGFLTGGKDIGLATGNIIQLGTMGAILLYFKADLEIYFRRIVSILSKRGELHSFWSNIKNWYMDKPIESTISQNNQIDKNSVQNNSPEIALFNAETDITLTQLAIATIPIIIAAYFFADIIDKSRTYTIIAVLLIFGSLLMWFGEYFNRVSSSVRQTTVHDYTFAEVILIGIFQALAIFPGISRSGSTLSGTLMLGHDRTKAVRFAFLLSIPSITLAGFLGIWQTYKHLQEVGIQWLPSSNALSGDAIELSIISLVIAFVLSFVFGYISLKWLLKFLASNSFQTFIIYRLILAAILLILVATKTI